MANPEQVDRHISEVNRQANARVDASKIHKPLQGERLATRPDFLKRQRHQDNLNHLQGRFHGTVYEAGKPRVVAKPKLTS